MAVGILSVSSVARDYGVKRQWYAALGVREYWICDVGGIRHPNSPVELQVYRMTAERTYAEVLPAWTDAAQDNAPTFWSEVCSKHIHMVRGDYAPRFQWYDENQNRWRDNETDVQDEKDRLQRESRAAGREEGREEGRTEEAVNTMREFLQMDLDPAYLDRIEAVWRRDGPPSHAARRVRAVLRTPNEWRTLLQVPDANDNRSHPAPPLRDLDPQ